jgi:putative restriction endonuclease
VLRVGRHVAETAGVDDDAAIRAACFAALDVLQAQFGPDVPWDELGRGFNHRGRRIPFMNRAYGIFRAAEQRGPAALSINSSFQQRRYRDQTTPDGVRYAYQDGGLDNRHNRALREAYLRGVPLVYFIGTRPGWYRPEYPAYITGDDPQSRCVLVAFGRMAGPFEDREPVMVTDEIERRYLVREVRRRVHQAQFRGAVIPAYLERCAICRLKEVRLLDAAHIVGDVLEGGDPVVPNGLSLCTIHHRAYDQDLVGISPDRRVHVARRLREDEDGPMLELLKASHGASIEVPRNAAMRPDAERLALRFERFAARD